jgi:DnaJ-class molecular chaperone
MSTCPRCDGQGAVACTKCGGVGEVERYVLDSFMDKGELVDRADCAWCNGTGEVLCPNCDGSG